MRTVRDPCSLRRVRRPIVLAAGFFDGVHRGHQKVIRRALARAAALRGETWVLTFDTHPLKVLAPDRAPSLLTSTDHKVRLLAALGADGCLIIPFTRRLAREEPEAFVARLHACVPSLAEILVGGNWRFGHRGRGDARLLRALSRRAGFRARVVRAAVCDGEPVSSTRIRTEVRRGHLERAAAMTGRLFSILGTVVPGARWGRRLGYPTANLDPHGEILPPHGVYAVRARLPDGTLRDGVLNHGVRPTLRGPRAGAALELHLFNFAGNLYRRELEVTFVKKLRNERHFASVQALQRQIGRDVEQARRCLRPLPKNLQRISLQPRRRPL